jgi:hypothetical protein
MTELLIRLNMLRGRLRRYRRLVELGLKAKPTKS